MHYLPPLAKLRKSLKLRSREFLRENTLHGFNYFVDSSRPYYERVFWFVCTLASFCGAVASIAIILQKFRTKPILTVVTIPTIHGDIVYPSMVLCMSSEYLNFSSTRSDDMEIIESYKRLYDWEWRHVPLHESLTKSQKPVNLQKLFFESTPNCEDFLSNCQQSLTKLLCSKMFTKVIIPAGVCCVADPIIRLNLYKTSSLYFNVTSNKTLFFYLLTHKSPNREAPITYELKRNIKFRISLQITTSEDETRLFSPAVRRCVMPNESPPRHICYKECQKKFINRKFGCLPWWLSDDYRINCHLHDYDELIRYKTEITDHCFDKCLLSCQDVWYGIDKVSESLMTIIEVKNRPLVRYKREVIFGLLELLVSFGGIMGLFLGYSVLTTVEFFYYFTLRTYCGAITDKEDINTLRFRVVKPAKPPELRSLENQHFDFYID